MEPNQLEQRLDQLQKAVTTAATEEAKKAAQALLMSEIKAAVEKEFGTKTAEAFGKLMNENEEVKGLKQWKVDTEKAMAENQKWIDEQIAKGKTIEMFSNGDPLDMALAKGLDSIKDKLSAYKGNGRTAVTLEMKEALTVRKTVGNIASTNFTISGTQGFINPSMFFEPGRTPYETVHMRDLFRTVPQGPSTDVYVIRDSGGEGGPTAVLPGAAKPQSDRDWVKTIVPITKIAHYYKIPEEYLDDIVWLRDEITGVGVEELLAKEDSLILTATASSTQFGGLNQTFNSTAFSAATAGLANTIVKTTNYDVLVAAWTQLRILKSNGTRVLMHPTDYARLIMAKDTTGAPLLGMPNAILPNVYGMPIAVHTSVANGKYFVGDFSKGKIGQRAGITVRFYDQNEDDAIKNMVTVVIEERLTFAMDRADRVIYGDFNADASAISASY